MKLLLLLICFQFPVYFLSFGDNPVKIKEAVLAHENIDVNTEKLDNKNNINAKFLSVDDYLKRLDDKLTIFDEKLFAIDFGYTFDMFNANINGKEAIFGNGFYIGLVEKAIDKTITNNIHYIMNISAIYHYIHSNYHGPDYYLAVNHFEADTADFGFKFLDGFFFTNSSIEIVGKIGFGFLAGNFKLTQNGDSSSFMDKFNLVYGAALTFNVSKTFGVTFEYLEMPKTIFIKHGNLLKVSNFHVFKFGFRFSF